jgi:hypothetical protein
LPFTVNDKIDLLSGLVIEEPVDRIELECACVNSVDADNKIAGKNTGVIRN